jgi:hypothetical protein
VKFYQFVIYLTFSLLLTMQMVRFWQNCSLPFSLRIHDIPILWNVRIDRGNKTECSLNGNSKNPWPFNYESLCITLPILGIARGLGNFWDNDSRSKSCRRPSWVFGIRHVFMTLVDPKKDQPCVPYPSSSGHRVLRISLVLGCHWGPVIPTENQGPYIIIFTKPSQLCDHANLLLGSQRTIGYMGPNNRFAWSQNCEGFRFGNMAPGLGNSPTYFEWSILTGNPLGPFFKPVKMQWRVMSWWKPHSAILSGFEDWGLWRETKTPLV